MYNGTMALKTPVQMPIIILPTIIIGPTLMKQTTNAIKPIKLVNKKQFLNFDNTIPSA
jgi:hypothetical protein